MPYVAADMSRWRHLLFSHRRTALMVLLAALAMRALVPAGFMLSASGPLNITVTVCAGLGMPSQTIAIPMDHSQPDQPDADDSGLCPSSALGHAALGPVDPLLLVAALAFILALGFSPARPVGLAGRPRLLPPGRAPPLSS